MTDKNNRITEIELRSRTKGRKFFPVSITLTQEQIDWLQTRPNASEIIRKLVDDLMAAGKDVDSKLGVISLNNQLEELEKQQEKLKREKDSYVDTNDYLWKKVTSEREFTVIEDGKEHVEKKRETYIEWENASLGIPKPTNGKDAEVGIRVVKTYVKAMQDIQQKIDDVKAKILQLE